MIDNMPCVPVVLQQLIDALQRNAGAAEYTRIALQDPVLAARVYAAAGGEGVHDGLVTCIARISSAQLHALIFRLGFRQALAVGEFEQYAAQYARLWREALRSATFARELASVCAYPSADEAYLAGLLFNIGQIACLGKGEDDYAQMLLAPVKVEHLRAVERQLFGGDHCTLGADIVESRGFSTFFADALRFQHEATASIQDAHPLVKIVHLSGLFAGVAWQREELMPALQGLFALDVAAAQTLIARSDAVYQRVAGQLVLSDVQHSIDAQHKLGFRLAELGETAQIKIGQLQSTSSASAIDGIKQWLAIGFGIRRVVLFKHEPSSGQLVSESAGAGGIVDLRISLEPGRSLVSDSLLYDRPVSGCGREPSTVVDRQLVHFLRGDYLQCWPLCIGQEKLGVLVYAIVHEACAEAERNRSLLTDIAMLAAENIYRAKRGNDAIEQQSLIADYRRQIREAVHEAGNPLSIIRNYLETVRLKLGEDEAVNESLDLVGSEISRVAGILENLREDPVIRGDSESISDANQLIENSVQIIRDSIGVTKNLVFDLQLGKRIGAVPGSTNNLKQVLMNLLKNAVEAQNDGGLIRVRSDGNANFNGQRCLSISVADDGPGLPEAVMTSLFQGGVTTKGGAHAGLGLGIVMKLINSMGGNILCRTDEHGTEFEVFLPLSDSDT